MAESHEKRKDGERREQGPTEAQPADITELEWLSSLLSEWAAPENCLFDRL